EAGAAPVKVAVAGVKACPAWLVGNAHGAGQYMVRYDAALAKRNAASLKDIPAQEAVALVGDAGTLAESAAITLDEGLDWGGAAFSHASPIVRLTGVKLVWALRDPWLGE